MATMPGANKSMIGCRPLISLPKAMRKITSGTIASKSTTAIAIHTATFAVINVSVRWCSRSAILLTLLNRTRPKLRGAIHALSLS